MIYSPHAVVVDVKDFFCMLLWVSCCCCGCQDFF